MSGYSNIFGAVGLAPGSEFVSELKEQGAIQTKIVSFDYDERNANGSMITFGSDNISKNSSSDSNLQTHIEIDNFGGKTSWSLDLEAIEFDSVQTTMTSAIIDTGNASIQVPQPVHDKILAEMRKLDDDYINFRDGFDHAADKIIRVNTDCKYIIDKLPSLKLHMHGYVLEIKPEGYVYPSMKGDSFCKIGISGVPVGPNGGQFRLGTIFLQNFYTALNFEKNIVLLKAKGNSSKIGKSSIAFEEFVKNGNPDGLGW